MNNNYNSIEYLFFDWFLLITSYPGKGNRREKDFVERSLLL